jgi:hypothetical protein
MRPEFSGHQAGLFPVKPTPPWSACAVMKDPEARPTQPQRQLRSTSTSMPSPSAGRRSLASVVSPVVQAPIVTAVSAWVPHSASVARRTCGTAPAFSPRPVPGCPNSAAFAGYRRQPDKCRRCASAAIPRIRRPACPRRQRRRRRPEQRLQRLRAQPGSGRPSSRSEPGEGARSRWRPTCRTPGALFDAAEEHLGPIDILVNNASGWLADTFAPAGTDQLGRSLQRVTADT